MTVDSGQRGTDRRRFLETLAVAGLVSSPAIAPHAMAQPMPMHGVLGAGGAGPGRPKIAMLVHPKMVMQDFVGPLTVFNLLHSEIHLVWKKHEPVMTEVGLPVAPSTPFADCPTNLDVLFVPGGLDGSIMMMEDPEVLEFLTPSRERIRGCSALGSEVPGSRRPRPDTETPRRGWLAGV